MRCICGFENAEDARFCGRCRTQLHAEGSTLEAAPARPHASRPYRPGPGHNRIGRRTWVALAAGLGLVLAGGAAFGWTHRAVADYQPDNGGLFPLALDEKFGFMDSGGKPVIEPQFDEVHPFSEGLAGVRIGEKFGFIDSKGRVVITPQFSDVRVFRYGRAAVKVCCGTWDISQDGDRFGIIDTDGKYINAPTYRLVGPFFSAGMILVKNEDGSVDFIDRAGDLVLSGTGIFDNALLLGFSDKLAPVGKDGKWGYIAYDGSWTIAPQFDEIRQFSEGLAMVRTSDRWGYVDRKGKFVVNPIYDAACDFSEKRACVLRDGLWGFIDEKGRIVIDPTYASVGSFHEGLAAVQTGVGWGYIDIHGNHVIDNELDGAEPFEHGLASVTVLGRPAYITKAGAFVTSPVPGLTIGDIPARRAQMSAESVSVAEAMEADARRRMEAAISGQWVGTFGGADAQLEISVAQDLIVGELVHKGWRELLRGTLSVADSVVLVGQSVSRSDGGSTEEYSLDTLFLEFAPERRALDGRFRDAYGNRGSVHFVAVSIPEVMDTMPAPPHP